jgi:hypothetical protein
LILSTGFEFLSGLLLIEDVFFSNAGINGLGTKCCNYIVSVSTSWLSHENIPTDPWNAIILN